MQLTSTTIPPSPIGADAAALTGAAPVKTEKKYIQGLDFLRAVAALSVCLYHFSGAALPKVINVYMKPLFASGWLGVDIFFVISGFIIPYSLLGKKYSVTQIGPYLVKRIIRINPPAYAAMALVLAQWFLIDRFINHNQVYTGAITLPQIFHNMIFTVPFTQYKWVVGIFWTLAIEFQFYIFIGLFFNFLFESNHLWKFVAGYLAVSLLQYLPFADFRNFFHYSSLFAMGGIALLYHQNRVSKLEFGVVMLIFTAVAFWQLEPTITLTGLATVAAILFTRVENKLFALIGKISYSFYLIHVLLGTTAEFVLVRLITPDTEIKKVIITLLCIVCALLGAYVFYTLVEKPFIELAKRYGRAKA
ncbi:acyltransferase family protein [Hymenobacter persicinus]|uniref:Acyltransferase n=1 Tax=Hymenobacter persicinus TaxID=2025506 RepID=A0A4Q5L8Q4_9BACT|nr:acyltransferase [Hymenobacter persicinus]RYU75796.1 acyltransferase [Hymenobacter persicinus]